MEIRNISEKEKVEFNKVVSHPLQSYEWGEFRDKTGIKVIRRGFFNKGKLVKAFTLTIHKIPNTPFNIGYLPKGDLPDRELLNELHKIGKEENCIFIQLEPNVQKNINQSSIINYQSLKPAAHPLFTKYTFVLDLTKSEDELLKAMHPKARYNIKVAQKHGVEIFLHNSDKAFNAFLTLNNQTTARQRFYSHPNKYFRHMRNSLKMNSLRRLPDRLTAHLLTAEYKGKTLTAWILFAFQETLYYPYGASSNENREVMASNLMMWEAIRFGKKLGLKKTDLWGSLGPNPDPKDPWFGFHNFKQKFAPEHVEFIGSYDLVVNPLLYQVYKLADKLRWFYLKLKK